MLTMRAPNTADQNPDTTKPRTSDAVSHRQRPLRTRMKEPEREQRHRQREHDEDRAHHRVDEPEDEAGAQRRQLAADSQARHDGSGDIDRRRIDEHAKEKTHVGKTARGRYRYPDPRAQSLLGLCAASAARPGIRRDLGTTVLPLLRAPPGSLPEQRA